MHSMNIWGELCIKMGFSHQVLNGIYVDISAHVRFTFTVYIFFSHSRCFWFDLIFCCDPVFFYAINIYFYVVVFFFCFVRFVINCSRNSLPEYVNIEWSPSWLVNRIHVHSVNSSILEMPTWYWMVPSSSNAYFSTEHWSDYWNRNEKKGENNFIFI